ncbi:hypothetical protein J7E25_05910 [Agromyces sp. ISL-38]|uniref:hypothetical protein n=1 Tax=Agromyces sp. ISL-38 TaxID=2819107 RepID=UPI001BE72A8F|nr:hypothetical protein [Agromyces sp. ISL-38]MBT2498624.1 hypothetical protein [Agromyces sp. ISL-38]MBT2518860.1 hypothetical protein [Streptomyces sp. ISL-90]
MARPLVVLDLAAGRALLGGAVAVVRARPGGAVEFGGRVIRPLRFGERWRLLDGAATDGADRSDGSLGASVLAVAVAGARVEDASVDGAGADGAWPDDRIARVLALHLAGARPGRAVPGCGAQLAALVAAGWSPRGVLDADADLIDLLTVESEGGGSDGFTDGGWTSIVLAADADDASDAAQVSLSELLQMLEHDLLGRLAPTGPDGSAGADESAGRADAGDRVRAALAAVATASSGSRAVSAAVEARRAATAAGSPRTPAAGHPTVSFPADEPARAAASTDPFGEPAVVGREIGPASPPRFPTPIRTDWPDPRSSDGVSAAPSVASAPSAHHDRAITTPAAPSIARPATPPGEPVARRATRAEASAAPVVVLDDAAASRTDRLAFPAPARPDAFDVADEVAALLDEESDLRGLRR